MKSHEKQFVQGLMQLVWSRGTMAKDGVLAIPGELPVKKVPRREKLNWYADALVKMEKPDFGEKKVEFTADLKKVSARFEENLRTEQLDAEYAELMARCERGKLEYEAWVQRGRCEQ